MSYAVEGAYLESCNCDAICPCRRVDGVPGGRSTHGICFGVLCWSIESGDIRGVDVGGLAVAISCRYDDDEPGSPWTFALHVDARGDDTQRAALADLFTGRVGGGHIEKLPWVRKLSHLLDVRQSVIDLHRAGAGYELRIGDAVELRAAERFATSANVACGIPGYDQRGHELVADAFRVEDDPFEWDLAGNCAYASRFSYAAA